MGANQLHTTSKQAELFTVEYVNCALCDNRDMRLLYSIPLQSKILSSIWVNDEQITLDENAAIVACQQCGLQFVNPRYVLHDTVAPYSEVMEQRYFAYTLAGRQRAYQQLIRRLPHWLGRDAHSLLDVGCGDGVLLEAAYNAGITCTGVEPSLPLQQLLQKKYQERIAIWDKTTAVPTDNFDVITLLNVIEHVPAPHELLHLLAHKLRPDGLIFVHTPNVGGLPARIRKARWSQIEPLGHLYYFSVQTLGAMLRKSGFEPIDRFHLAVSGRIKERIQLLLGRLGLYMDNGLGIVARRKA